MSAAGNEQCWVLLGHSENKLWWGIKVRRTVGQPCSVAFDADYVLKREESHGDLLGFKHTHPGMQPIPSDRDVRTMNAWADCLGKDVLCLIEGIENGKSVTRGYWFLGEGPPVECQVKEFRKVIVGTTELEYGDDE